VIFHLENDPRFWQKISRHSNVEAMRRQIESQRQLKRAWSPSETPLAQRADCRVIKRGVS
jgi:hypothetical protein